MSCFLVVFSHFSLQALVFSHPYQLYVFPYFPVKPSTPTSGKRKSSSRLSLFHSTARKSRASAGDLNLPTPNGALTSLTDGSSSGIDFLFRFNFY